MTVSVIVPGFNNPAAWWERCVRSLLAAGADEVICVDDGSDVALKFPSTLSDPRILSVFLPENRGLSEARNAGIEVASGDYVTFVDSDDEVLPETFSKCREAIARSDADVAVYGVKVIWTDEGLQKTDSFEMFEHFERLQPEQVRFLDEKKLFNYSCNKVYRKSFLEEHRLRFDKEGMPCEDFIFNVNCLRAGASYCFVPFAGYVYYRRQGTLVARYNQCLGRGVRLQSAVARSYKAEHPGSEKALEGWGELSPDLLDWEDWRNAWLPGTPYSLLSRWKMKPGLPFIRMLVFMFVRRYFYVRSLRRMNLRRNFPNAVDCHEA